MTELEPSEKTPILRKATAGPRSPVEMTPEFVPPYTPARTRPLRNQSRRVILRNQNLTSIPPEELDAAEKQECTVLELARNRFSEFPLSILRLADLVILDLANNNLETLPDEIDQLKGLKKLNLNNNHFQALPLQLNRLPVLEQLLISHNHLESIPANAHIPLLRVLYASHNDITAIPISVGDMEHLQEIHMKNNLLLEFEFVEKLTNLNVLDLSHNMINSLPNLSMHFRLIDLNLSYNRLGVIPFVRGVTMFNISYNFITSLRLVDGRREMGKFDLDTSAADAAAAEPKVEAGIASESINETRLSVMGNSLVVFNISGNRIQELNSLFLVHNLQELVAFNNEIEEIPESFCKLTKLQVLNVAQNRIKKLPKNISKLTKLKALHIQENQLDSIPASLVDCTQVWPENGGSLNVSGNPLSLIPGYYRPINQLYQFLTDISQDSQRPFIRSRVMVVGDSGVGKTTLVRKITNTFRLLQDGLFSADSTVGFECTEIQVEKNIRGKDRHISLCFWDFGGEGQYRDAHAFFSSSSAQYILAFDVMRPSVKSLCNWFNLIQTTAPGAIVYLVATHYKKAGTKEVKAAEDIVRQAVADWKPAFSPRIQIIGHRTAPFWAVSNTFSRTWGTTELGDRLAEYAASHVKRIPRSYLHLMTQVIEKKRAGVKVLSWADFAKLSKPFEFSARKLKRSTKFLHEWGFVFHFPEEIYGQRKWVIINPEWLMKLFTSVIGYRKQREHHGPFVKESQLLKIWKGEALDERQFNLMVGILEKFRMMIQWRTEGDQRQYLIPTLLTKNPDDENWTSSNSPEFAEEMMSSSKLTHFRIYGVPYSIPGLFTGLIVKLRKRVPAGEMTCWKNTMILRTRGAEARLSLEPCLKSLSVAQGIHVYIKAVDQESCNAIVCTIHWEMNSLLAFSYQSKLLERVQDHTWVYYQGLWIKRQEVLVVFNESEEDHWEFCGVEGDLQSLLPEMYCLAPPEDPPFGGEITHLTNLQNTAYGEISRGTWAETGEQVLVKHMGLHHMSRWISRAQTSFVVDRFFTEVKSLSQLQHRNIVRFQTYYSSPPVLVEEFAVEGRLSSLLTDVDKKSRMSWPLLIRIAHDIALALQYLHNQSPQMIHGNLTMDAILISNLDVNADQVIKVTDISLKGNNAFWVDTAAYVGIVRELVDQFIVTVEAGDSKSVTHYAEHYLDRTDSTEDVMGSIMGPLPDDASHKQFLKEALGAELVYDTVSDARFRRDLTEEPEGGMVPQLLSHIREPSRVVVPKIFQRILQFSGHKKLPDFDQICSLFTTYLNPEKTSQLIRMRIDEFADQSGPVSDLHLLEDSPPRVLRKRGDRSTFSDDDD